MPIMYKEPKYAYHCDPESLTEQEHKDSCDVNKMIKNALRGLDVRGNASPSLYGHDDMNLDGLQHRINKQNLENKLRETARTTELTEEELKLIPDSVKAKFKFKTKKKTEGKTKTEEKNDDKTTKKTSEEIPQEQPDKGTTV